MRAARLQNALERLTAAIRNVESELAAMKAEQDPLASHIFVARRHYRNVNDTKSGKRREMTARLSFDTACELGFRGSLDEWGAPDGSSREAVKSPERRAVRRIAWLGCLGVFSLDQRGLDTRGEVERPANTAIRSKA